MSTKNKEVVLFKENKWNQNYKKVPMNSVDWSTNFNNQVIDQEEKVEIEEIDIKEYDTNKDDDNIIEYGRFKTSPNVLNDDKHKFSILFNNNETAKNILLNNKSEVTNHHHKPIYSSKNITPKNIKKPEITLQNKNNINTEIDYEYCTECFIDIPLRAKHCKICKNCFSTFDHHCIWIGNCIAEKNKRLFILFLFLHSVLLLYSTLIVFYCLFHS